MTTVLFLWFAFAFAVGFLAKQRGRSMFNWFVISAIASPVLGFVLLMMMKACWLGLIREIPKELAPPSMQ